MKKMSLFGCGPKIATILLPWFAITILASIIFKGSFIYSNNDGKGLLISGGIILLVGLIFYVTSIKLVVRGIKESKLITTGTYYLCQNPLYAAILIFIIPAISLLSNSWLIATSTPAGYVAFRLFIHSEYNDLESIFGNDYLTYKNSTPEFIPLPFKKLFSKS
jgi:protein-S-isoprenylcysteine O-methyltransferase Ste14